MRRQLDIKAIYDKTGDLSDDLRACDIAIRALNSGNPLTSIPIQEDHYKGFNESSDQLFERYQTLSHECLQATYKGNLGYTNALRLLMRIQAIAFERLASYADMPATSDEIAEGQWMLNAVSTEIAKTNDILEARQTILPMQSASLQQLGAMPTDQEIAAITQQYTELEDTIKTGMPGAQFAAVQTELMALACDSIADLIAANIDKINTEMGDIVYSDRMGIILSPEELDGKTRILNGLLKGSSDLLQQGGNYMSTLINYNQAQSAEHSVAKPS